jgi:hypothetical protein
LQHGEELQDIILKQDIELKILQNSAEGLEVCQIRFLKDNDAKKYEFILFSFSR